MEEESFTQSLFDTPDDLAADGTLTVMRTEDFCAWYRRVRNAHEREVDGGVDAMTDAELAKHGLCRIGSAAMWDELRDTKDRELSEEHGLVRLPTDADGEYIHIGDGYRLYGYRHGVCLKRKGAMKSFDRQLDASIADAHRSMTYPSAGYAVSAAIRLHEEGTRKASPSIEAKYHRMLEINDLLKRQQEEMRMLLERQNEEAENAKLREQMERLVTLLRVDCDIDASWDGLRRFWSIGLTEDGCLMRDRACKAEAENAKLRELVRDMWNEGAFAPGACYVETDRLEERTRELGVEVDE